MELHSLLKFFWGRLSWGADVHLPEYDIESCSCSDHEGGDRRERPLLVTSSGGAPRFGGVQRDVDRLLPLPRSQLPQGARGETRHLRGVPGSRMGSIEAWEGMHVPPVRPLGSQKVHLLQGTTGLPIHGRILLSLPFYSQSARRGWYCNAGATRSPPIGGR